MRELCVGCRERLRWWHRLNHSGAYHQRCWTSWRSGYDCAWDFAESSRRHKSPEVVFKVTAVGSEELTKQADQVVQSPAKEITPGGEV